MRKARPLAAMIATGLIGITGGTYAQMASKECLTCHEPARATDLVYVQGYPVLNETIGAETKSNQTIRTKLESLKPGMPLSLRSAHVPHQPNLRRLCPC